MFNKTTVRGCMAVALAATLLGGTTMAQLVGSYVSPLSVSQTITPEGGGEYLYNYSFTNVDTSPIWGFGVYTRFSTSGGTATPTMTGPFSESLPLNQVYANYDARNLDPLLDTLTYENTPQWPDDVSASIEVGSSSQLSFLSGTYDPSSKYYYYETIASGWTQANGSGDVAAVGLTTAVPEPSTLALLIAGAAGLLAVAWRRKRHAT
jgi:hypothetical protein